MATIEDFSTIPYDWYFDPAVARLEQERIFRRTWQYAAHSGELTEPGSFVSTRAGNVPVVIVRGRDNELRAFVNVCRHRGYLLCDGAGKRETLQCPYHAWTYDLDGSLRSAPRSESEPGFDRENLGLVPMLVDTWGPFVFVNPDTTAGTLAEHLGDLPRIVAEGGVDVDALVFHQRFEVEYDANWKVCVENYLECYHCAIAHPSFSKAIDVAPETYAMEEYPTFSAQFGPPKNGGGGVYDATGEIDRGQFHLLFPGTTLNVMPGRGNFSIGPVIPLGNERTYRFLDYFFLPDTDPQWIADYLELDTQVGAEDRVLVERVQVGMRSGIITAGTLMPQSERLIGHFERLLVDALGADG
ncbi:MAG: aromatic ring-hydroxylating dioxygenase subunit alpha [Thermoleophilia bacterium]|nr:aromatic ring-hydroxylating dioxygenase subunit alpha [Thermoleophilia bacterium]